MISSIDEPIPTVLGLLVLGNRPRDFIPGAFIQFLRLGGTELSAPVLDEDPIDGPISQMLRRIDEKMEAHNRVRVDLVSERTEKRDFDYPMPALQQIVRNAVMHRMYERTNSPVRIYWFKDRIEVISPGGPFGEVTAQNFGKPGFTDYRNPNIADAMRVYGFVQRFGVGIATAQKELRANGNPPAEFTVEPTAVLCIMRGKI